MSNSKYFSEITMGISKDIEFADDFFFIMKNVTISVAIANCIRRIVGLDIATVTISPETVISQLNTSVWDNEMIIHQISYVPMKNDFLKKLDLNMIELILDVTNDKKAYRYVMSGEFLLKNKETNKIINSEDFLVYKNMPLFLLGPYQQVKLSCKLEYLTKKMSDARHQAAFAGFDYIEDSNDPKEILFNVNIQTGMNAKELISYAFDNLILRLKKIQENIKKSDSSSFYIQLNRYHRYDLYFIGEDHSIGHLIEKWNNRHDTRSVTGYRQTRDNKSIYIDYGLEKFSFTLTEDNNLENIIEKSISSINEEKEKIQRSETLKMFIENVSRLEIYITELKDDFVNVKINSIPIEKYMDFIHSKRIERIERP